MVSWAIGGLVVGLVIGYFFTGSSKSPFQKKNSEVSDAMSKSANQNTISPLMDEDKIKSAIAAAPEAISKEATVLDWPAKENEAPRLIRKGTNTWTCLPDYPASPGNDPLCGDEMAMQWFGAYMAKKTPSISQNGIGYMLQGGSSPSNTDPFATEPKPGDSWMVEPPHIMVFPSSKLDTKVYGTDHMSGMPWIMYANTPYAHLMIPVQSK